LIYMEKENKFKSFLATRKKMFWIIGVILLVLVLAVTVILPLFNRDQSVIELQTGTVTRGSITETVDTYGVLEAQPSVTLSWESDGVVGDFNLTVGDTVQKGDVLMELDPSSQSTEILDAYTDILDAKAELELLTNSDAEYQDALNNVVYEEKMLINKHADKLAWNYGQSSEERVDAVWDNYYAARSEVWVLEDAYDEVKSLDKDDPARVEAYDALQAGILKRDSLLRALNQILGIPFDIAVETDFIEYDQQVAAVAEARVAYNRYVDQSDEISAAQAAVQILQNKIDEAKIIAPFDGTVTAIDAVTGDVVSSGTEAVRIDYLGNLLTEVTIPQADINKIKVGQTASLSFDAITLKEYTGFVQSISEAGTADTNGVVQFTVVIKLEDADEDVKPGFTAVVNIVVSEAEDVLLVPNQAVTTQDDGTTVVAIFSDDGSMNMVPVKTGAKSDAYTEIVTDQIEEGAQVAIFTSENTGSSFGGMRGMGGGGNNLFGGMFRSLR
jgi:HlyD family secretion protein